MSDGKPLEVAVEQLLNLCNLYYLKITNYRCFQCGQVQNSKAKGYPDYHIPRLALYVECKMGKGRLSKDQKRVRDEILTNPMNTYLLVVENVDTLLQFLKVRGYIKP